MIYGIYFNIIYSILFACRRTHRIYRIDILMYFLWACLSSNNYVLGYGKRSVNSMTIGNNIRFQQRIIDD